MSNFFTLFNYASNRPHNSISLEQVCSLVEGVSYFQICKKSTKLGKNIDLLVHFPAEKCTKIKLFAKSVLKSDKKINTHKYFIIHNLPFDRLLIFKRLVVCHFLFNNAGKAISYKYK